MKFTIYDVLGDEYLLLEGNEYNCAFSKTIVRGYLKCNYNNII